MSLTSTLTGKVLLVSDPNQGRQAEEVVRRRLPSVDLVVAIWERGTPKDPVRAIIRGGAPFDAALSFNNDFLFQEADLRTVGTVHVQNNGSSRTMPRAYNIHPSLVRGMGYGTTPLYEDFPTHGAVAHFMDLTIDTGPIFDVLEVPLPRTTNFRGLRLRTHLVALALLDRLLQRLTQHNSWDEAHRAIAALPENLGRPWNDRYVSITERDAALRQLLTSNPRHRVFDGMPMEDGIPLKGTPDNIVEVPEDLSDINRLFADHGV